jgi:DNA repair protein RadD
MIQLRPYQTDGLNAIWSYFQNGGEGNPLIAWPTGVGKSIIPAVFIESIMRQWPSQRFLMITHVKELIQQNLEVLKEVWPNAPVGIYSAGLDSKDSAQSIIFGGIQSMIKNPMLFGHRDIIFIDEAHLISQDESSTYLTFISAMKTINPHIKIIGLTATPFRMGHGYITDSGLFTDIVHDLTSMENFNILIKDNYLSPLIPLRTNTQINLDNVAIQKNEFVANSLQKAMDKQEITYQGLKELVSAGYDRRSWLIFASGIEHAEHIASMLGEFGIDCAAVHSKKDDDYNDAAIKAFKEGGLRSIVNYGKLTTGFNCPHIDLIGMLRPTLSIPLWVQMLGRGTRPADGKRNCLVLDYAHNTRRLGPINDPQIPRKKGEGAGEVPIKLCDHCGAYNHARVQFCCNCGEEFKFQVKFKSNADHAELIKIEDTIIETFNVDKVIYSKHVKMDRVKKIPLSAPMIKAQYHCGKRVFNEYVGLQHTGLALHKARDWWRQRHKLNPPITTDEALTHISELRTPKRIKVEINTKYPNIIGAEW